MVDWHRDSEQSPQAVAPAASIEPLPETATDDGVRAEIVDRNGLVLATNMRVPGVHADPSLLADKAAAARQLAAILPGVDAADLQRRLESGRRFAWIKHRITPEEQVAVLELGLPGVGFSMGEQRVYPKEQLTSHVTGFVDVDGRGLSGIERYFDDRLRRGGEPVVLSLDLRIQQIVREELADAYHRFRAIGANAMVLDRTTGELLSMVSLPDFDPNRVGDARKIEYLNRNTGGVYELGSVFKLLTIAAALDSGQVSLHDKFDATGKLQIGRYRIGDDHAKKPLAVGARDLRVLVQYRGRADGVRRGRRAAVGKLLSPGGLLQAGPTSRSPRRCARVHPSGGRTSPWRPAPSAMASR